MSLNPPKPPSNPAPPAARAVDPGRAEHVVALACLWVGQDLVRLVDLLEALLRLRGRVDIRVPLLGKLAERALQLGVGRSALDPQDLVVIAFRCGHRSRRIREEGAGRQAMVKHPGTVADSRSENHP